MKRRTLMIVLALVIAMVMGTTASAAERKLYLANKELEIVDDTPDEVIEAPAETAPAPSGNTNANPSTGR